MRQLFVPACLCLMTWSGSIGGDTKLPLEGFSSASIVDKAANTSAPATQDATSWGEASSNTAAPPDAPIDIPTQTGLDQTLEPQPIPLPPIPKPVVYRSRQEVCDTLIEAAQSNDLPVPFFIHLLFQESRFQPEMVSSAGAQGVAQFMPETAASVGLDNPFDPIEAIPASARLLRNLFQQFGNLGLAAAAYNAGPRRIQEWLAKKGKLPQETQGYVKTITGRPAENWTVAETGTPEMRLPRRAPCQDAAGLQAWNGPAHIPVPVPSPHMRVATATLRGTIQPTAPGANVTYTARLAIIAKTEKTANASAAKAGKGAIQLAARKSAPGKAKRDDNAVHTASTTAAKPLRLAVATRGSHK